MYTTKSEKSSEYYNLNKEVYTYKAENEKEHETNFEKQIFIIFLLVFLFTYIRN